MKFLRNISKTHLVNFIQISLIFYLIILNLFHLNTGLADNGDFSRVVNWFSSKPTGFQENWPLPGTADYELRFFNYWLPYWDFDFPKQGSVISSTIILWLPGLFLNGLIYSNQQLFLPIITIFPRFLIILFLWIILKWISRNRHKLLLTLTIGIPYVLIFTSTDYIAYFNSFYQELGSLIFVLLLIITLVKVIASPQKKFPVLIFGIVGLLLTTSKASNLIWVPILMLFFIYLAINRKKFLFYFSFSIIFLLSSASISYYVSANESMRDATAYSSLFYGALSFSSDPVNILGKLHLGEFRDCINVEPFTRKGDDCVFRVKNRNSHLNSFKAIIIDPNILINQLRFGASNIQNLSLDYLGKFSLSDPIDRRVNRLNLWSTIKFNYFPKNNLYFLSIAVMALIFLIGLRVFDGSTFIIALIGIISAVASVLDLFIAVFGDGRRDILKHLLMSNFLFDIALISFISLIMIFIFTIHKKIQLSNYLIKFIGKTPNDFQKSVSDK